MTSPFTKPKQEAPIVGPKKMLMQKRGERKFYWSRLGWSQLFGMAFSEADAELRVAEMSNAMHPTAPPIEIVPYAKIEMPKRK